MNAELRLTNEPWNFFDTNFATVGRFCRNPGTKAALNNSKNKSS